MGESTPPAGATPAAAGATPAQTPPAPPAAAPITPAAPAETPPAPDGSEALGDAGKRALDAMKAERKAAEDRAKAAEAELERIKVANLSDAEKAIAEAKKTGATEAAAKLTSRIRTTEVRAALIGAGAVGSLVDLAVKADEFASVKVSEDGEVSGLDEAVAALKKAHPELFAKAAAPGAGSADQGPRGGTAPTTPAKTIGEALERRYAGGQ